jgi:hypothetical protein
MSCPLESTLPVALVRNVKAYGVLSVAVLERVTLKKKGLPGIEFTTELICPSPPLLGATVNPGLKEVQLVSLEPNSQLKKLPKTEVFSVLWRNLSVARLISV